MNINEIAKRAGVSRATVSRYLNDGYVSQEKRELIARIIKETGYVPSQRGQQLRTGKTGLVGVIMPKINSQSVSRMVEGISLVLSEKNYQTVLACTHNQSDRELDYLKVFSGKNRMDGIILISTVFSPQHVATIDGLNMPFVSLGQKLDGHCCVYQDDYHAMYDITRLVLPKSKELAYMGVFEEDFAAGKLRHEGFLDACASFGITPPPETQKIVDFSSDAGYFGAEQILDVMPNVDTVVCATDEIAFGVMMCMHEYGRRVPEDVQITGMGDSLLSRIIHPSLTTAHLPFKTSGMLAAKMLLDRIASKTDSPKQIEMDYDVYARNTMR